MTVSVEVRVFSLTEDFDFPEFESPQCAGSDPEIFFPRSTAENLELRLAQPEAPYAVYPGKPISPTRQAKAICHTCSHMSDCRDFAINNDIRWGIWGGTTELERRRLRKLIRGDSDG